MNVDDSAGAARLPLGRDLSSKKFKDALVWLALLGLIVRVGYLVEHARSPFFGTPTLDEKYYVAVAKMFAAGDDLHRLHGFRPLLYPLFLAACNKIAGAHGIDFALMTQHALGIATGIFVALLGARLFRHRWSGIFAGGLYLLAPVPLSFEGEILIEASYTFLIAVLLWAHFKAGESDGLRAAWLWLLAGALTAFAAQARVNILVMLAVYPALALWNGWRQRNAAALVPLLGLVGALLMAIPWGVFNMRQSDHFHLLPGAGGINLYIHNRRSADGVELREDQRIPLTADYQDSVEIWGRTGYEAAMRAQHRQPDPDPMAVSRYWTGQAIREIKADPGHWVGLLGKKLIMTFWNVEMPNLKSFAFAREQYLWLRYLPVRWVVLLALAPAGLWAAWTWGRRLDLFILLTFLGFYSAANLLFFFCDRYRYPTWPAMAVLAGGGLALLIETIHARRSRQLLCLTGSMALMAALSLPNWAGIKLPSFSRDYLFRSMAWFDRGHFPEALADVDQSLRLDRTEITAMHHRANILLALDRLPEARAEFEQALRRSPDEAVIWNDYGAALEALGQTNNALQAYHHATHLVPPSLNAFLSAAILQIQLGQMDEATRTLDLLHEQQPNPSAMALALRSVIARRSGHEQEAARLEEKARRMDSDGATWIIDKATKSAR
jgi:Tfp pilus assembly protein PilF